MAAGLSAIPEVGSKRFLFDTLLGKKHFTREEYIGVEQTIYVAHLREKNARDPDRFR
jgi:hypothetical protein